MNRGQMLQCQMPHLQRIQLVETLELSSIRLEKVVRTERALLVPRADEVADVGYEPVFPVELVLPMHALQVPNLGLVESPSMSVSHP